MRGETTARDGTGVLGHNTATTGRSYRVERVTESAADGAAGIRGEATPSGTPAETYGVTGLSNADGDPSTDRHPAGVYGAASGSSVTRGVLGKVDSPSGRGVVGTANAASGVQHNNTEGVPAGVLGSSDRSGQDGGVLFGVGVVGLSTATSGRAYGVYGQSRSADGAGLYGEDDDGDGYAVYANGDGITLGSQEVTGRLLIDGDVDTGGSDYALETGTTATSSAGNVIHGHASNRATSGVVGAVVGGGGYDDGSTSSLNEVSDDYGTVASGLGNTASGPESTVCGGDGNTAGGFDSTVGGGDDNRTGKSGTNKGAFATVPGGRTNVAEGYDSFAAGREASALHRGTFVWSDSGSSTFASTGADQFLIDAAGGVGIGTNSPVTTFHVKDAVAESNGDNLGRHVAAVENTSTSSDPIPDVLGSELTNVTDPGEFHSYISFMDSTGTIGNIQGDGNGGVEFVALVGGPTPAAAGEPSSASRRAALEAKDARIEALEAESERKDERIEELERRLATLEARVSALEPGESEAAPADD